MEIIVFASVPKQVTLTAKQIHSRVYRWTKYFFFLLNLLNWTEFTNGTFNSWIFFINWVIWSSKIYPEFSFGQSDLLTVWIFHWQLKSDLLIDWCRKRHDFIQSFSRVKTYSTRTSSDFLFIDNFSEVDDGVEMMGIKFNSFTILLWNLLI